METPVTTAWFDYSRASEYSGLGRTTLSKLVNAGEIKAARVGRAVRISRESLDKFMERQTGTAGQIGES